jgi:hypothetical protein
MSFKPGTTQTATCSKQRFSKAGAAIALWHANQARDRKPITRRHECRTYYCNPCRAWHLTSLPRWA